MAFSISPIPSTQRAVVQPATSSRRRSAQSVAPPRMTLAPHPPKPSVSSDSSLSEPVTLLTNVTQYLETLERHKDQLVVLKVFAPWCRSCLALTPKFNRLAREFPEIKFVKLNYEESKDLCYRIGVTTMPTFVFYAGQAGEIEKFSCGPQRAAILREKIEDYLRGECYLGEE